MKSTNENGKTVAEAAPTCPCCQRPMVPGRDGSTATGWMAKCFACAQQGFGHRCPGAK